MTGLHLTPSLTALHMEGLGTHRTETHLLSVWRGLVKSPMGARQDSPRAGQGDRSPNSFPQSFDEENDSFRKLNRSLRKGATRA